MNCWICGKPVSPNDFGLDEFGFNVHAECDRRAIPRKPEAPKAPPKPDPKP
jgi:hypothetical protein